ncbi:hypothetical protein JTE90_026498 [Oedothorax gibbosus]|uniref:ATP-dependent DNA helicase n=1 Tax=Oedothorax gibbosus TaxID=931172 RepID=A0AAV6VS35_9ARAC|nr:hypothetical protein JTE90_026498 [Oedothorax gibbosus]
MERSKREEESLKESDNRSLYGDLSSGQETQTVPKATKRCRSRCTQSQRKQQLKNAKRKYSERNPPEVNRAAVQRYQQANPEVNRAAVQRYQQANPEVHKAAVQRYQQANPEVNRAAVQRYQQANPEVNRAAVQRYQQANPEVNRAAAQRYQRAIPEVHRAAVQRYQKKKPEVHRSTQHRYENNNPDKRVERKTLQWKSACICLGLLDDDKQWESTLMLLHCELSDPLSLWEKYKDSLSEDIKLQVEKQLLGNVQHVMDEIYNRYLVLIEDAVLSLGGQSLAQYSLPRPKRSGNILGNREYMREASYDKSALIQVVSNRESSLTDEQLSVYHQILASIQSSDGRVFFLDAPGGTGKTFLINLLLAKNRLQIFMLITWISEGMTRRLTSLSPALIIKIHLDSENRLQKIASYTSPITVATAHSNQQAPHHCKRS